MHIVPPNHKIHSCSHANATTSTTHIKLSDVFKWWYIKYYCSFVCTTIIRLPLSAATLVFNTLLATNMLNEPLYKTYAMGTSILAVMYGPQNTNINNINELQMRWIDFILTIIRTIDFIFVKYVECARIKNTKLKSLFLLLSYCILSCYCGSLSLFHLKSFTEFISIGNKSIKLYGIIETIHSMKLKTKLTHKYDESIRIPFEQIFDASSFTTINIDDRDRDEIYIEEELKLRDSDSDPSPSPMNINKQKSQSLPSNNINNITRINIVTHLIPFGKLLSIICKCLMGKSEEDIKEQKEWKNDIINNNKSRGYIPDTDYQDMKSINCIIFIIAIGMSIIGVFIRLVNTNTNQLRNYSSDRLYTDTYLYYVVCLLFISCFSLCFILICFVFVILYW